MFSIRFRLSVSGYVLYSKKRSLCSESESEMFSISFSISVKIFLAELKIPKKFRAAREMFFSAKK